MPAVRLADPRALFGREEWAALTTLSRWRGVWLVVHAWGAIALAIGLALWAWAALGPIAGVPAVLAAIVLVGGRQLGLAILMHDGAHGLLHPNRKLNNFLGGWLCGAPTGTDLKAYRAYHLKHHKFTQQAEDPDLPLSAPFPVSKASLRRKIARDLTGRTFLKQRGAMAREGLAGARAMLRASLGRGEASDRDVVYAKTLVRFVLTNGIVLAVGWVAVRLAGGSGWLGLAPFAIWLAALATVFQLIVRIRNIAEHACAPVGSEDPFTHARTTLAGPLARATLAPYWVNFHSEHHLFMGVPCYRLPLAHRKLGAAGHLEKMWVAPGYRAVLRQVSAA